MRRDHLTIVAGMSLLSGVITGIIIYAGGLFAAPRVVAATAPAPTLPPPEVITVLAPTATAAPVPTPAPTAGPVLRARLSHYWPAWGPPSCIGINWVNGECTSTLTDGRVREHWSYFAEWGMACPARFALGTKMKIPGFGTGIWSCTDRGGAINVLPDGTFFLDLLTREQPYIPPSEAEVIYDSYSPHGSLVVVVEIME